MRDNMTVDDAINVVHVLGCELASDGNEDVHKLALSGPGLSPMRRSRRRTLNVNEHSGKGSAIARR